MTTRLDRPLRREVWIDQKPYTLTLTSNGFVLAQKRRRKGTSVRWKDLVNGEVQTTGLRASASQFPQAASTLL